jgi:hypothetical protein
MVIDQTIQSDFDHARRKASWRSVIMRLVGRRNELLRFDEVRRQLRAQARYTVGSQEIPLDAIVGSVGRYRDFDAAFLPRQSQTRQRWLSVDRAYHQDISLPPVELYRLGATYFVKDGNHRVSVARERGQSFIDAVVVDVQSPVPIACLDELEAWLEQQDAVDFLATTRLLELRPQAEVRVTLCGQYDKLLEHISVHRWFLGVECQCEVPYEEAVASWYDRVYTPLVDQIRQANLLAEFPKRTEADLYVWLIEHLWYLREAGELEEGTSMDAIARTFGACFSARPRRRMVRAVRHLLTRVRATANLAARTSL